MILLDVRGGFTEKNILRVFSFEWSFIFWLIYFEQQIDLMINCVYGDF